MSDDTPMELPPLAPILAAHERDRAKRGMRDLELLELMFLHVDDDLAGERPVVFELIRIRSVGGGPRSESVASELWRPLAAGVRERLRPRQRLDPSLFGGRRVELVCARASDGQTVEISLEGASFRSRLATRLVLSYADGSTRTLGGDAIKWGGAWSVTDSSEASIVAIEVQVIDDVRS